MDEISNGLDSSTTFQIVSFLGDLVHITESTALISLFWLEPHTSDLFDDVILMAKGKIVYHGPCSYISRFFEDCGFMCPERKVLSDFLQEIKHSIGTANNFMLMCLLTSSSSSLKNAILASS